MNPSYPNVTRAASTSTAIAYWKEMERGRRLAAVDAPDLFVRDLCAFFAQVR
jgi:hypothetical protein